jgi:hypothetical protein
LLSHNVVSSTPRNEQTQTHNFSGDRDGAFMKAQEEENGLEDEEKVKGQYCSISRAL